MTLKEARDYAGYVLRGIEKDDLVYDIPQYVGTKVGTGQKDVPFVLVYVPENHVFCVYDDAVNQSKCSYEMVLVDAVYNVYYPVDDNTFRRQREVSRDLILKWYYRFKLTRTPFSYDLMCVPLNLLGTQMTDCMYRSLSWWSFVIQPGLMITISIRNSDVRFVPKMYEVDGCLLESRKLENYVNINLSEDVYSVSYKSAATAWRTKVESVGRHLLMEDYYSMVRAKLNKMSLDEWMSYIHGIDVELEM